MPERIRFMGVTVNLTDSNELWSVIQRATAKDPVRIATLNPEFMLRAQRDTAFRESLAAMTHCSIDGTGLYWTFLLSHLLYGIPHHPEHYHGADLVADLFHTYANGEKRFYLLGGPPGLAEAAAKALAEQHPGVNIVGAESGGKIDEENLQLDNKLTKRIIDAKPDVLLVGFGAPKQELWIHAASDLPIPVMIGIGGTFGFYSSKSRAPRWMRALHLEWLYRALTERGHWKRAIQAVFFFPLRALGWLLTNKPLRGNERT